MLGSLPLSLVIKGSSLIKVEHVECSYGVTSHNQSMGWRKISRGKITG